MVGLSRVNFRYRSPRKKVLRIVTLGTYTSGVKGPSQRFVTRVNGTDRRTRPRDTKGTTNRRHTGNVPTHRYSSDTQVQY